MRGWQRSPLLRYIAAVWLALLAAVVRWQLDPWLGDRADFLFDALVVLVGVMWCGVGPAWLTVVCALLFRVWSAERITVGEAVEAAAFVLTAAGVIYLAHRLARTDRRAASSAERADQRAREAGRLAEELELLVDGARNYAIYLLDANGNVTIWNSGAARLTGWSEDEVLGRHFSLFFPEDAVAEGQPSSVLERAAAQGQLEDEAWRYRKDGSEFLASITVTALYHEDGSLRGFAKVVSDVTERRAGEAQLRSRENLLSSVLSTVPDAMVVIDENAIMISFSRAAEALFGYSEAEAVGRNVSMLMPSPDRERHDGYVGRYLETGAKRIIGIGRIVVGERKDGSTFPMELAVGEAITGNDRLFTGFIRDLTERERTQERMESLRSELIHVSRVSAMGTMASTVAHELNQPIAAIANYAEAVRDMLAQPDADDFPLMRAALDETAKEALRAGHIVRRLRDFVARGELEKTVEPLSDLINETWVLGHMMARERGVTAQFDIDPYASPVFVDRIQVQQVLLNLIRNACEAMSEGEERRLFISTRTDEGEFVQVSVADTGPGVAPAIADQLFTAFVSTKAEGMGLGLSICRTIIEANGGRIWMAPREGGGTVFNFTLQKAHLEGLT